MKVFTAALGTETNTFSPLPTGLSSFYSREYFPAGTHPDRLTFYGGPLWVSRTRARDHGWDVVEGLVASAQPGGITTRSAYETLRDEILSDLQKALPVDMVLLGLHGAMVADGYDDCEGDMLSRVRALVGDNVTIGAELDPHAHLSPLMVEKADVLVLMKEYPHKDVLERANELVDLCTATHKWEITPVAAVVDCEMVVPFHTTREPARGIVDRIQALEGKNGVLSISIAHGFATGDTPDMGTRVLVYTDGDREKARSLAEQIAAEIIACRDSLLPRYLGVEEAISLAHKPEKYPIVLADRSDNPGSGAAGDSTFLLAELLRQSVNNVALGPLWDPQAVRLAFEAGVGARLSLRIGGKVGPMSGSPVDATCTVISLQADMTTTGNSGTLVELGDCALIEVDGIEIALISFRTQGFNTDLFTNLGCDIARKKVIIVKSAQHFYDSYSKIAAEILYVGAPGSASPNWKTLPYQKISRPKWPIDS